MEAVTQFYNARLVRNHQIVSEDLWISQGKIISPQERADLRINAKGLLIAPGYIDLQINGGFGVDFATQAERVEEVAKQLPRYGVTSFLPTLISCFPQDYRKQIPQLHPRSGGSQGAHLLGIHLEGPWLNPAMARAHDVQKIAPITTWEEMYGTLEGVKLVTLAPELAGACEIIEKLSRLGIVVAAGHTEGTFEQMERARMQGLRMVTHLFNAMPPLHHRAPGVVGMALTHSNLFYSLIADGVHLHSTLLKLAWRANPEGLCLVSDAMEALGLAPGQYHLGIRDVEVNVNGAYIKGTNTLAGSVKALDAAVRYFWKTVGCSVVEAVEAASWKTAKILNLEQSKGTLQVGADADLVFLDEELVVQNCYVAGQSAL